MFHAWGNFVVRRARLVLIISGLLVVAAGVLAAGAFSKLQEGGYAPDSAQSTLASNAIDAKFGGSPNLVFLVRADSGTVDSPALDSAGEQLASSLRAQPDVTTVTSYWDTHSSTLRSSDGTTALVLVHVSGDDSQSGDTAKTLISKYAVAGPSTTVRAGGPLGIGNDITNNVQSSLVKAEGVAIPITMLLLLIVFGSVVAALLPLAIGLIGIVATFAELSLLADVTSVSVYATNLTTAMGLGLAIDYALLSVSRFREELANGGDPRQAVIRTVETAGRTIVFSGATVAVALASLLVFQPFFLRSFAYAGIGVVAISVLGGVVVLPALLTVLGPRVNAWRLPWSRAVRGAASPLWGRIAAGAMRRPAALAIPAVVILLVVASPLRHVSFATPDDRVLPTSAMSHQVGDTLRSAYSSDDASAIDIVTTGPVSAEPLGAYAEKISGLSGVKVVQTSAGTYSDGALVGAGVPSYGRSDAQLLEAQIGSDPATGAAQNLVRDVRAVAPPLGTKALVGGASAQLVDTKDAISSRLGWALGWIVLTTFILLFLFTGSVIQPLRALLLGGLGLTATLGAMVWVFQYGHLSSALGFTALPLDTSMPVLLFCIAFGLSMDYEVFLISRIKELHDAGTPTPAAVVQGLSRTGRIVSTAAMLIAISFIAFGTSTVSFGKFFGIGTAIAILLDATVMRGVLVPVAFRLLGESSWYAPGFLRRLHRRVAVSESAAAREDEQEVELDPAGAPE